MKKKELKKLALLGLSAGILLAPEAGIQADESNPINLEYVLAKPSCKAHGGCGGLTASRDVTGVEKEDAEEPEDADDAKKAKKQVQKTNSNPIKKSV